MTPEERAIELLKKRGPAPRWLVLGWIAAVCVGLGARILYLALVRT